MTWPVLAELKQVLNVDSTDWDDHLTRVLAAGISKVKLDVGDWDDATDVADEDLAAAALVRAEMVSNTTSDPEVLQRRYNLLLKGRRRRFSIG